ncbi:hypothetical protein RAA17_06915 [Komagataeibacter rhaeticus]|nr:hypothetical protein [Komagataeibacter rhaeticus]
MIARPGTGHAADPTATFPAQRQEIVEIMRNALKTDPTILSDAIAALRSTANAAQQNAARSALESHRADLLTPAASDAILGNPQGTPRWWNSMTRAAPTAARCCPTWTALRGRTGTCALWRRSFPYWARAA